MSQMIQLFKLTNPDGSYNNKARLLVRWDGVSLDKTVTLGKDSNTVTIQVPFDNDPDRQLNLTLNVSPEKTIDSE